MDAEPSAGLNSNAEYQQRSSHGHDTHAIPPQGICDVYKKYRDMSDVDIDDDSDIIDFTRGLSSEQRSKVRSVDTISEQVIDEASREFLRSDEGGKEQEKQFALKVRACDVYSHIDFPGLRLLPALLPPAVQVAFLDRILHRELSQPLHKINLQADYAIPYPPPTSPTSSRSGSFFTLPQSSTAHTLTPLDPHSNHKSLNLAQALYKRWRWLTIGAQYDWPTRQYPLKEHVATPFPPDIAKLVSSLFPDTKAESGVVLIYSPKDFMPVHRDVSEHCERDLCSFTLGCDGLFIVALDQNDVQRQASDSQQDSQKPGEDQARPQKTAIIRVRSGDVVTMSGPTRWAWHAMPKVMAGTCPEFLKEWPVKSDKSSPTTKGYRQWKGYMTGKRINISCRQVYD